MAATDFITEAQGDTIATDLATAIKAVKLLVNGNANDLSGLTTTDKSSLQAAVNELQAAVQAAANSGGAALDDTQASTSTVYSSAKTVAEINAAVDLLTNNPGGTIDSIVELLANDNNLAASLANRLRFDATQTLDGTQQAQGQANLGIVRSTVDFATQIASDLA